ncbi:MAG: site-specific integrase [Bacteroidetes bacterium]|nr:site-specific integrase [Bacteroidota bacterium]
MGVYLREKKLGGGQVSYYLDIYHNKARWYEFLEIRINKAHPTAQDKEKKRLVQEIRIKRENELIVQENGLVDKSRRKADFLVWFEKYVKEKNCFNTHNQATISNLKKYLGKKPLPFSAITPEWIKGWTNWLLGRVQNNTARNYLIDMFTGLEDAVRLDIIPVNPFRKIPRKDRIKQQDTFRRAYTLEELQLLVETTCNIHPQIKQAYLFSCFTGLRWSDVNQLRWAEVIVKQIDDNEEWFIYFEQAKTEGIEYMPLADQAVEILKNMKKDAQEYSDKSPFVFPCVKEFDDKNKLMNKIVNRALKKWAKKAGLDEKLMHFHTSRHTFATNILEHSPDADLWTVSKLLGHKTINATQIYTKVRDKKKSAAVKGLPKLKMKVIYAKVA